MGDYELDLKMCGISTERFGEIFILRMTIEHDRDGNPMPTEDNDIYVKVSEDRSLFVGNLINGRWIDIKGNFILKFLSNPNFTPAELGNIIHFLKFVDDFDFEGDTDDE